MITVRERREQLAHHLMGQAVALPRVGFTLMSMYLWENAGVLLSSDPEGDEILAAFEAENGTLIDRGEAAFSQTSDLSMPDKEEWVDLGKPFFQFGGNRTLSRKSRHLKARRRARRRAA